MLGLDFFFKLPLKCEGKEDGNRSTKPQSALPYLAVALQRSDISGVLFWIQKQLPVLRGLKSRFQKLEIQGLTVLLIIYLFSLCLPEGGEETLCTTVCFKEFSHLLLIIP